MATLQFTQSVRAWGTPRFEAVLKDEIEQLDPGLLPLQQCLSVTSHAADGPFKAMILGVSEEADAIRVKAGIFFSGIVAGCSCADDPTPVEEQHEYCELLFEIDKATTETTVNFLAETGKD